MSADGDLLGPPGLIFGTMFGIVAFLLGLLVTSLVFRPESIDVVSGSEVPEWQKTIWYFFDAQYVDITTRLGSQRSGIDLGTSGFVGNGLESVPVRVVAPLAVFAAGATTVAYAGTSSTLVLSGMTGAMTVLGYLVAAGGAALAATYQSGQPPFGVVIGPNYVYVLVVSIVLSVVFGGAGGLAYHAYRDWRTPDSPDVDLY